MICAEEIKTAEPRDAGRYIVECPFQCGDPREPPVKHWFAKGLGRIRQADCGKGKIEIVSR